LLYKTTKGGDFAAEAMTVAIIYSYCQSCSIQ